MRSEEKNRARFICQQQHYTTTVVNDFLQTSIKVILHMHQIIQYTILMNTRRKIVFNEIKQMIKKLIIAS